jgi:TRAP-type C4-dicarboxylate transport system substrate-binding protein
MDVYIAIHEYEVAPYVIDHPFYKSTNVVIMNLKKWNSLPDHLKKLVDQVQAETEKAMLKVWEGAVAGIKKKVMSEGAKFIKLEPDTAKWYVKTFYDVGWKYSEEKFPPDVIQKFKKLITK